MRHGITMLAAAVVLAVSAVAANAQTPAFRPIDTNALVVKPVDTTSNIFTRSTQTVGRVVAGMIDNSQIIRTVNNLFGKQAKAAPTQGGISPLPDPKSYQSTYYKSQLTQAMPSSTTIKLPGR